MEILEIKVYFQRKAGIIRVIMVYPYPENAEKDTL